MLLKKWRLRIMESIKPIIYPGIPQLLATEKAVNPDLLAAFPAPSAPPKSLLERNVTPATDTGSIEEGLYLLGVLI